MPSQRIEPQPGAHGRLGLGAIHRRLWRGKGAAVALFAISLALSACYAGPGIEHFTDVLDEIAVPQDWQLVKTETRGPNGDSKCDPLVNSSCPAETRWYFVDDDPSAALDVATSLIESAGFEIDQELHPACDGQASAPACAVFSQRGEDRVRISIYRSTDHAGIEGGPKDGTTVAVVATGPR